MEELKPIELGEENRMDYFKKFKASWYFDHWYEKVLLCIGVWSLLYSVLRILIQGWW